MVGGAGTCYMVGMKYLYGGVVSGVVRAVGMGVMSEKRGVKNDCWMGVVFSGMLGLGIMLMREGKS
ncbi:metal ABC transporter permease, partial [Siminovitchia fortis]|uniref:metal ABC transporter permease n=1 Tax=Siminovitchia fortis TaxID=254758 RepID=UPI0036F2EC7D